MKQTSGALSFLLSAYRSVFSAAYAKGIAAAVVLTAGLAAGSANAAVTSWADGTYTTDNPFVMDGTSTAVSDTSASGDVVIESGEAHTITAGTDNDHGVTVSGDGSLTLNDGKLTLTASNSGDISIQLGKIDLNKGTLALTGDADSTILLSADDFNIGIDVTTGEGITIGSAADTITIKDGGSITNASHGTVIGKIINIEDGGIFTQQTGSNLTTTGTAEANTQINVKDGGLFNVGSTGYTSSDHTQFTVEGEGLQATVENAKFTLGDGSSLNITAAGLKSYFADSDTGTKDHKGILDLSSGSLVFTDTEQVKLNDFAFADTAAVATNDDGSDAKIGANNATVEGADLPVTGAITGGDRISVTADTLTLGETGKANFSAGTAFTVRDSLIVTAAEKDAAREVKDSMTFETEKDGGTGTIEGGFVFNASGKTLTVKQGSWTAEDGFKIVDASAVTVGDANTNAQLKVLGAFDVANSKSVTVGNASSTSAVLDLTEADLVNNTEKSASTVKGTLTTAGKGVIRITGDKLTNAVVNDAGSADKAGNLGYIFNITSGGTLEVTEGDITVDLDELVGTAGSTSSISLVTGANLDAENSVLTVNNEVTNDAGTDAGTLNVSGSITAKSLNLNTTQGTGGSLTQGSETFTLATGTYNLTDGITASDKVSTISIGKARTSAAIVNLASESESVKTIDKDITVAYQGSGLNINDGNWALQDVSVTSGSFTVSVDNFGGEVSVQNLTASEANTVLVEGDDLTVNGELTATKANAVQVNGGTLTLGDKATIAATATGAIKVNDGAQINLKASQVLNADLTDEATGYSGGAIALSATSSMNLTGLEGTYSLEEANDLRKLILGAGNTSGLVSGVAFDEGVKTTGDVAYTTAKVNVGWDNLYNENRITGVNETVSGSHHWGSVQLASGITSLGIAANGGVVLSNATEGKFVTNASGDVAGVNFSGAGAVLQLEGTGEVGDITATNSGHGTFLAYGDITAGDIGAYGKAIASVVLDNGNRLTASSLYSGELSLDNATVQVVKATDDAAVAANVEVGQGDMVNSRLIAAGDITLGTASEGFTVEGSNNYIHADGTLTIGQHGLSVLGSSVVYADYLDFANTAGTFYLDPSWQTGPSVGVFGDLNETGTNAGILEGKVVVGQNSAFYVGENFYEDAFAAYARANLSQDGVQAIAYLDKTITVGDSTGTGAQLIVDGSLTGVDAAGAIPAIPSDQAVYIAENSKLVLGNDAFGEDGQSAAITLSDQLSTNDDFTNEGVIEIAPDKVRNGTSYTLVQNDGSGTVELGTVESANKLFGLNTDNTGGTVTYVYNKDGVADAALAKTDASIRNMINAYATNKDEPGVFDVNEEHGVGFVSRAVSLGSAAEIGKSLDSAAQFVTAGGVPQVSLMAQNAGVNAIETRLGFNGAVASTIGEVQGTDATVWVTPLYSSSKSDSFDMGAQEGGVDADLFGVAVGSDFMVADALRLGVAFNVGSGESDSEGDLASTSNDFDFLGAGIYGGYEYGALAIMADLGYTMVSSDIDQSNAAGALSADIDSTVFSVGVQGKYTFDVSGFDIAPHLGVRYTRVDVEDYTVSGVIDGDSIDQSLVTFPVGVTFSKDIAAGDWDVKPVLDLSVIPIWVMFP